MKDGFFAASPEKQHEYIRYIVEHIRLAEPMTHPHDIPPWIEGLLREYKKKYKIKSFKSRVLFNLLIGTESGEYKCFIKLLREVNSALKEEGDDQGIEGLDWDEYLEKDFGDR